MKNKTFIIILALFLLFLTLGACVDAPRENEPPCDLVSQKSADCSGVYMKNASAVTVEREVFFTDEDGNVWVFQLAAGEPEVNQHVILVLYDNNTPTYISDDEIVEWR